MFSRLWFAALSILFFVVVSIFISMPFALASVCKPFVPVIFKRWLARFTAPVPKLPEVFKLIALIAVFTASPVTTFYYHLQQLY